MEQDLSSREFELSYWLYTKRPFFKKLAVILFAIADGLLVIFVILAVSLTYNDYKTNKHTLQSLSSALLSYQDKALEIKPKALEILEIQTAKTREGSYDIIAEIANKNDLWILKNVKYYFKWESGQTEIRQTFVYPGRRHLIAVDVKSLQEIQNPQVIVEDFSWFRMNQKEELLKFKAVDFQVAEYNARSAQGIAISEIKFKIKNKSPYDFDQVDFIVIVKRKQGSVAGQTSIVDFFSRTEREVEVGFGYIDLTNAQEVVIEPLVMIF